MMMMTVIIMIVYLFNKMTIMKGNYTKHDWSPAENIVCLLPGSTGRICVG